jgi:hypothetical protein
MDAHIGEWYLCEAYIEEPVRLEALEADRIQVTYLTTGRTRWLGYPRIWQACKPHALAGDLAFDARSQMIVMRPGDNDGVATAARLLSLSELRGQHFPHLSKAPVMKLKKTGRPKVAKVKNIGWEAESLWDEADDAEDASSDEHDYALDDARY